MLHKDLAKPEVTVRKEYTFRRPPTPEDATLLMAFIDWRGGSSISTDESGRVTGCIGHPDDVCEFKRALRKRKGRP